ncbi:MAG: GAF domain-containing protein [Cyclobacteriaceae bacterium]|nr:GAF domain-containing protein [Cyclobacteriaceae bacterium]
MLGNSLIEMRNRLQEVAREDKIRNWTNEGQAKFGELLRLHSDDLETLGAQLLSNLIDYLNASQGALFVLNEDGENHLELLASYANKRRKFLTKQILPGEGLVGQVFEEGKTTYLTDIRTDHYNIETGLGESKPSSLLIVPLKEENKVEGVIEISITAEVPET